jgi:hypothetical protein
MVNGTGQLEQSEVSSIVLTLAKEHCGVAVCRVAQALLFE